MLNSLQELFPQVDSRILKAVSIEHPTDVDAAVEFILNEVALSTSTSKVVEQLNDENVDSKIEKMSSTTALISPVVFYDCDNVDDPIIPDLDTPEMYETNISVSCVTDNVNLESTSSDIVSDLEDGSSSATVATQSGEMSRIEVLEEAINEAKDNKRTLFSSMESVINMMKKAEDLETAADEAKEEAVKGGVDILAQVEELRKMLLHAKEANDMHAGEVYGEKAVLATEARELQARLMNLFDERNQSLAVLDEMRQVLEARLAAAEEIIKAAAQDGLHIEESARKVLLEQEFIMEKVVEESKRLQSEAEQNAKLREFLMDRGQIVDVLQGEMAVICLDIKSLKENFDERAPLSKSLSSSQTSCLMALSGSSGKSQAPNFILEQVEPMETTKPMSTTAADNLSEKSTYESSEDRKHVVDNDWALPKMTSSLAVDNLSEKSASEWGEDRMNSLVDDWDLPQTKNTMFYDNMLGKSTPEGLGNDDWDLL